MADIYIAGPLFTPGDREFLEKIDELCKRLGYSTYLPHRDIGLFTRQADTSEKIFERDVKEMTDASSMIAVLNGQDVDSGTSWELGYAWSKGTYLVGLLQDTRVYDPKKQLNPMVFHCLNALALSLDSLEEILRTKQ